MLVGPVEHAREPHEQHAVLRLPAADGAGDWLASPGYDAANDDLRRYVCEDLDRVRVPTTIAWGELDRLVGPPKPHRRPAGARFLTLPDVGHTPTWDDPELVARTLLKGSAVSAAV